MTEFTVFISEKLIIMEFQEHFLNVGNPGRTLFSFDSNQIKNKF